MSNILIEKPQFNTTQLQPGSVLKITATEFDNIFDRDVCHVSRNCLVVKCTKLELEITFVDLENYANPESAFVYTKTIDVEQIVKGTYEITIVDINDAVGTDF